MKEKAMTGDKPLVQVGQTWKNLDKRYSDTFVRVVEIKDGKAICANTITGKKSVISISRMRPCHNGYRLEVQETPTPLVQQDPAAPTPGAML